MNVLSLIISCMKHSWNIPPRAAAVQTLGSSYLNWHTAITINPLQLTQNQRKSNLAFPVTLALKSLIYYKNNKLIYSIFASLALLIHFPTNTCCIDSLDSHCKTWREIPSTHSLSGRLDRERRSSDYSRKPASPSPSQDIRFHDTITVCLITARAATHSFPQCPERRHRRKRALNTSRFWRLNWPPVFTQTVPSLTAAWTWLTCHHTQKSKPKPSTWASALLKYLEDNVIAGFSTSSHMFFLQYKTDKNLTFL